MKAAEEAAETLTRGTQVTKQFVHTAEGRLQDLVAHYGAKHPDRLLFDECGQPKLRNLSGDTLDWNEAVTLLNIPGPRPLVFIELERSVPILPMAGGTQAGATVILAEKMIEEMRKRKQSVPDFPADDDQDSETKKAAH